MNKFRSVFWQLFGAMLLAVAMFAVLAAATTFYFLSSHVAAMDEHFQRIGTEVVSLWESGDEKRLNKELRKLRKEKEVSVGFFSNDGVPLAHMPKHLRKRIDKHQVLDSVRRHWRDMHRMEVAGSDGTNYQFVFQVSPMVLKKNSPRRLLPIYIGLAILSIVVVCLLVSFYFVKPIRTLQTAAKQVAGGQYDMDVLTPVANRRDEHGDLARDFMQMAKQIELQIEHHQRLLRDISHDLRTPLTRQQLAIELASQHPENVPQCLDTIGNEIEHMQQLLAHVLSLFQLNSLTTLEHQTTVDISSLLSSLLQRINAPYGDSPRVVLANKVNANIQVDETLIVRALENILSNAVKFSPDDKPAEVAISTDAEHICLSVRDYGTGIPEDELPHVFDAFYQVDNARSGSDRGHGLGLSISKRILDLHDAGIVAQNSHPGLTVTVRFSR